MPDGGGPPLPVPKAVAASNTAAVAEILSQLKSGRTLEQIAAARVPAAARELLGRCAWVRTFDRDVVERVLLRFPEAIEAPVPFDELVRNSLVEGVPRRDGVYQVRDRAAALADWVAPPTEWARSERLARLSRRLVEFYQDRKEPLEELYHRVVADPETARSEFERGFRAAEKRYDLTGCDLLIRAVERPGVDPELDASREQRAAWLRARGMWVEDYLRTARFVDRPTLTAALERLLRPAGGHRVLQLHATGGFGKTQFIRWVLARYCADRRVPCARLDFDDADAAKLEAEPVTLALALARQYDRQFPNAPFADLLNSLGLASDRADPAALARFAAVLTDALSGSTDGVAVLVLDTLEEVLLPRRNVLLALLDRLAGVSGACPRLRLVLSGRHDLTERLSGALSPQAAALFRENVFLDRAVPPFTRPEGRVYLTDLNGLPDGTPEERARIDAVLDRAEGVPLKLSLYVELLRFEPELTAEKIRSDPNVDVTYLIRRIVMRLRNPDDTPAHDLRLVLRYGAIPRRLTAEFLSGVLIPIWNDAVAADQMKAGLPDQLLEDGEPFRATEPPAPDPLWDRLRAYASASSWVRLRTEPNEPDALLLQNEVVNPMRRLLREAGQAYRLLHREAIRYFSGLAAAEPDPVRRATRLVEVTYHDFQLRGASAGPDWRARLTDPALAGSAGARLRLAEAVVERPFLDDDGRPRAWADGPIIDWADLAFARFHIARARADQAAASGRGWREAADALGGYDAAVEEARKLGAPDPVAVSAVELVRGLVLSASGQHENARSSYAQASRSDDQLVRCRAREGEGDALAASGRPRGAIEVYESVAAELEAASAAPAAAPALAAVREKLAQQQEAFDRLAEAARNCRAVARMTGQNFAGPVNELLAPVASLYRRVMLRTGRVEEADRPPEPVPVAAVPEPAPSGATLLVRVGARLAQARPFRAHEVQSWETLRSGADPTNAAAGAEAEALVSGALMRSPELVVRSFEHAQSLWATAQQPEAAARVQFALVRFTVDELGDRHAAEARLRERNRLAPQQPDEVRLALAEVELRNLRGEGEAAAQLLAEVTERLAGSDAPPGLLVACALTGLLLRHGPPPNGHLELLVKNVRAVTPAGARAVLLEPLARCPEPIRGLAPELVTEFLDLLPFFGTEELGPEWTPRERALCACRVAEAARVMGRNGDATRLLADASDVLLVDGDTRFPLRALADALTRTGNASRASALYRRWATSFATEFGNYPNLVDAVTVGQIERALDRTDTTEAAPLLDEVLRRPIESSDRPPLLRVRLMAAHARWAALDGHTSLATAARHSALELYGRLGRPEATIRLTFATGLVSELSFSSTATGEARADIAPPGDRPLYPVPPALTVAPSVTAGEVAVEFHRRDGEVIRRSRAAHPRSTFEPLIGRSFELATRLARQPTSVAAQMAQMLTGAPAPETRPVDVCLAAPDVALAPLPWSWVVGRDPVGPPPLGVAGVRYLHRGGSVPGTEPFSARWLRAAVDAATGPTDVPSVSDSIRALQARAGLPVTGSADAATRHALWATVRRTAGARRVLVVRPAESGTRTRGADPRSGDWGAEVAALYRAHGFEPLFWSGESTVGLDTVFQQPDPPAIVHAVLSFEDVPSLGVCLRGEGRHGYLLGASHFTSALGHLPVAAVGPMIVLDPPRPSVLSEAVHQLLLRNTFATELYHSGTASLVVATGLGASDQYRAMTRCVVECVAGGWTAGGLLDVLRRQGGTGAVPDSARAFEEWLAPASASVFTADPETRLPGP